MNVLRFFDFLFFLVMLDTWSIFVYFLIPSALGFQDLVSAQESLRPFLSVARPVVDAVHKVLVDNGCNFPDKVWYRVSLSLAALVSWEPDSGLVVRIKWSSDGSLFWAHTSKAISVAFWSLFLFVFAILSFSRFKVRLKATYFSCGERVLLEKLWCLRANQLSTGIFPL